MTGGMSMKKIYQEIMEYINNLEIIDTHEHLPSKEEDRDRETDVLKEYLTHYFCCDLISAGLPREDYQKIMEEKLSILEKWNLVDPYWDAARYTGYGRALDISVKELYGIDSISKETIEELNIKFKKSLKPGHFAKVLKDKAKIVTSLLNVHTLGEEYDVQTERTIYCNKKFFSPVYIIDKIVFPLNWDDIYKVEVESGIKITSFFNWLAAAEVLIEKAYKLGAVALKSGLAYQRPLNYERVLRSAAEEGFNHVFKTKHLPDLMDKTVTVGKAFQDYMFHFILDIANDNNMVIQIHTGIQEGSGNILSNSNPELLSNLFLEYPDVGFDIFHMGYPYQNELTVLAKNFPNVFIDMCWAHILSPNASVNALLEWVDTIPLNKISAFGGDYVFVDGVYGHLQLAKENVAKALSIKVREDLFDVDRAKEISRWMFYDNPKRIFKL